MFVCKQCGVSKHETEFHKSKTCARGHRIVCKACVTVGVKAYQETNREKVLQQKREERQRNKDTYRERDAAYYEATKDRQKTQRKEWYERNKESAIERATQWNAENPERRKVIQSKNKQTRKHVVKAEYERNKADYFSRAAGRRVTVKQATPQWVDKDQVAEMYIIASKLNGFFTKPIFHVDHVVPLNNPLVCGLHVHTNLEVIPAKRNLSKGNRYWPDMP